MNSQPAEPSESLPPATAEAILEQNETALHQLKRIARRTPVVRARRFVVFVIFMLWCALHNELFSRGITDVLFSMYILSFVARVVSCIFATQDCDQEVIARISTYQSQDIRLVGPLLEILSSPNPKVFSAAAQELQRLLPRMQHSDASLLTSRHRTLLRKQLQSGGPIELKLAILKALEQIGDEQDVPVVRKLAEGDIAWRVKGKQQLQTAAQECLPYLEAQVAQTQTETQLLRASSEPQATPETLLRAAHAPTKTPADQLLRATISEEASRQKS